MRGVVVGWHETYSVQSKRHHEQHWDYHVWHVTSYLQRTTTTLSQRKPGTVAVGVVLEVRVRAVRAFRSRRTAVDESKQIVV